MEFVTPQTITMLHFVMVGISLIYLLSICIIYCFLKCYDCDACYTFPMAKIISAALIVVAGAFLRVFCVKWREIVLGIDGLGARYWCMGPGHPGRFGWI